MKKKADPEKQTKEYRTWKAIQYRCDAEGDTYYHDNGIRVCKRWKRSYATFLNDMGRAPSADHSIDRLNSRRGYSPKNCRWATDMEQGQTMRSNHWIEYRGERKILADWERETGIGSIGWRLNAGWPLEKAMTQPVKPRRPNWSASRAERLQREAA